MLVVTIVNPFLRLLLGTVLLAIAVLPFLVLLLLVLLALKLQLLVAGVVPLLAAIGRVVRHIVVGHSFSLFALVVVILRLVLGPVLVVPLVLLLLLGAALRLSCGGLVGGLGLRGLRTILLVVFH